MLHIIAGVLLCIVALVAGVWGLVHARRMASPDASVPAMLRQLLALVQTLVVAAGLFGLLLLTEGRNPDDPLHVRVYGPFMVVALIAAYGFRVPDGRRNLQVFAVASLAIFALGLRAVYTGR